MSKVAVLGAGVIGITTAYYLNKAGFDVDVFDPNPEPAFGTSFANAGQISVGYSAPWASPGVPLKALKWMFNSDAPFKFKYDWSFEQLAWLAKFLRNCNAGSYDKNKQTMIRLAQFSQECFNELRLDTNIQYEGRRHGTLQLFRDKKQLENASKDVSVLESANINYMIVNDRDALIRLEPGLKNSDADLIGGLWIPGDETGDCNLFCHNLEQICKKNGVQFHYNCEAKPWVQTLGSTQVLQGVVGNYSNTYASFCIEADYVIVASGVYSKELLKDVNVNINVYPVRGHSLTLDIHDSNGAPVSTVLDETYKVAVTRFDNRIRAGGFAEVVGYTTKSSHDGFPRMMQLLELVEELFPDATDPSKIDTCDLHSKGFWSGLRPMTPNGIPLVGETNIRRLFVNTGHGTLGWTMSCGSGQLLANIMTNKKTESNAAPFLNQWNYSPKINKGL